MAGLGTLTRSGGTVNLTGTLDNTGTTLALTAATGSWDLLGGTITGGTVTEAGGAELIFTNYGGTLDGVTFDNDLDLASVYGANATITDGLTLHDATVDLGSTAGSNYGRLYFSGTQTLGGTGTVAFGTSGTNGLFVYSGALTIGSGITVSGSSGFIEGDTVVNQGTISANAQAGGTITVNPTTFTNQGTLEAENGEALNVSGLTGNLGKATLSGSGSSLSLSGTNFVVNQGLSVGAGQTLTLGGTWSNAAGSTIAVNGGTLNLGGSFTIAGIGTLSYTGGTVNLTGTLDNTGTTLAFTAATGSWDLLGGTITGGTVTEAGGAELIFTNYGGTLDGVTFDNDLDLASVYGANATITDGLTLHDATVDLGSTAGSNYGRLYFSGTQTLGGTGTVAFGTSGTNGLFVYSGALTIGSGITVSGSSGFIEGDTVVNQGTISANAQAGGTITVNPTTFTNQGTLAVSDTDTLTIPTYTTFTNFSNGTLSGGTYNVGGTFQFPNAAITTDAANISLSGTTAQIVNQSDQNALSNLSSVAAGASLQLAGGARSRPPRIWTTQGPSDSSRHVERHRQLHPGVRRRSRRRRRRPRGRQPVRPAQCQQPGRRSMAPSTSACSMLMSPPSGDSYAHLHLRLADGRLRRRDRALSRTGPDASFPPMAPRDSTSWSSPTRRAPRRPSPRRWTPRPTGNPSPSWRRSRPRPPATGTPTGTVTFYDGTTRSTPRPSAAARPLSPPHPGRGDALDLGQYAGDTNFTGSTSTAVHAGRQSGRQHDGRRLVAEPLGLWPIGDVHGDGDGRRAGERDAHRDRHLLRRDHRHRHRDSGRLGLLTTSALAVAGHSITAKYGGDTNFTGSTSSAITQTVNQDGTHDDRFVRRLNPADFGQSVTFTAAVSAAAPGSGTPTGTVTFYDGTTAIDTATLGDGSATFTTSSLAAGSHAITPTTAATPTSPAAPPRPSPRT